MGERDWGERQARGLVQAYYRVQAREVVKLGLKSGKWKSEDNGKSKIKVKIWQWIRYSR